MPNKPLGQSSREDVLNPQQSASLLMVAFRPIDKVIVHTLLYAGLRVSELCHMRRDWLNYEEGTLTVPMRQFCQCWECLKHLLEELQELDIEPKKIRIPGQLYDNLVSDAIDSSDEEEE
ncbi:hypothetical protein ACFLW8_03825 [Chloroflexota bacterium]